MHATTEITPSEKDMANRKRSDNMIRRPASPEDLPACFEIYAQVIRPYVQPGMHWDEARERTAFLGTLPAQNTAMFVRNEAVVGFDSFYERPHDIWLNGIFVLAEHDPEPEKTIISYIVLVSAVGRQTGKKMRMRILKTLPHVVLYRKWGFQVLDEDDNYFWLEGNGTYGN